MMENEKNIDVILKDLPNVPENGKSNIKWLLLALNPVPLEFYRHLNRKTKHIATDAYTSALSTILTKLKDVICKERIQLLVNIQIRWQNGEFKREWTAYIAEKSVTESVRASYYVQRNYNSEISSYSIKQKSSGPSTPNKPIIQQDLKRKFPHVSFIKRAKFIYDKLDKLQNESLRNLEPKNQNRTEESENEDQLRRQYENEEPGVLINNEDRNNYDDQVVAEDWQKQYENEEPGVLTNNEDRNNYDDQVVARKQYENEEPGVLINNEDRNNYDDKVVAVDWRDWLENILELSIEDVRAQILSPYIAKNEFENTMIKYIGKVLMDFVHKVIDVPGHIMPIDTVERDWIVNKISPLFTFLQATFINKIRFHWIEYDVEPTHERLVFEGNTSNKDRLKADIVGVRLSDSRQVIFLEMSGAPTDFLKRHSIDDVNKSLLERIDALNSILINFLRYDVRFAGKICSFTIQGIRDRLTLRALSLRGKDDYVDEEILSAVFPLSWDFRFQFYEIFNMMEYIIMSVIEYPNVIKELLEHPANLDESSIRYCISDSGCYRDY